MCQCGRMPKHHRQRQIQHEREPHGILKLGLHQGVHLQRAAHQVQLGKVTAVDQCGQAHHADEAQGVENAQHQHIAFAVFSRCEACSQDKRHGKFTQLHLARGGHQSQRSSGQQHQGQKTAQHRHDGEDGHAGHEHEEQAAECEGLLPKSANALAHPE